MSIENRGIVRKWLRGTYGRVVFADGGIYDADVGVCFTGFGYAL